MWKSNTITSCNIDRQGVSSHIAITIDARKRRLTLFCNLVQHFTVYLKPVFQEEIVDFTLVPMEQFRILSYVVRKTNFPGAAEMLRSPEIGKCSTKHDTNSNIQKTLSKFQPLLFPWTGKS